MTSEVLSKKTLYAHGTLGMPLAVIGYPLAIWIPAHYSGGLGISLATVGTILMLARLTDVITDPMIGERGCEHLLLPVLANNIFRR